MNSAILLKVLLTLVAPSAHSQTCEPHETWISPHSRNAYQKKDGTAVAAALVVGHCRIKSKSYEYWSGAFANGKIEGWPHKTENFKDWARTDLERVVKIFDTVPIWIWERVKLYRAEHSETKGNPATSAAEIIVLYDQAFHPKSDLKRILVHELAHEKFKNLETIVIASYQEIAGWRESKRNGHSKLVLTRSKRIAPDSDESPGEDFANNLEFLIFEPQKLKLKNPAIYDWFIFEYGDKIKLEGAPKQ